MRIMLAEEETDLAEVVRGPGCGRNTSAQLAAKNITVNQPKTGAGSGSPRPTNRTRQLAIVQHGSRLRVPTMSQTAAASTSPAW